MRRAIRPLVAAIVLACLAALPMLVDARTAAGLPGGLTDREFWRLSTDLLRAGRHVSIGQPRLE